ncbi:hemolysin [Paraphotobacterium marinum]|uniref:L-ornithine N(alpha)-acyltransferase n=1 Tax=Paraphotobacterium marinum TaxID=1755811 RepID=A0A220VHL1_9GAMM|nr:lysophospholipid acyltransferase family protein [Paraphotobacterium marinum]ASK79736.1 hemolysin [Paraphotobacterium marinum]
MENNFKEKNNPFYLPRKPYLGFISSIIERIFGLKKLQRLYETRPNISSCDEFLRFTLDVLKINYKIKKGTIDSIPESGPCVIVANHPLGGAEGVILSEIIRKKRKDVRILANDILKRITELSELFIDVDVFAGDSVVKANLKALRTAQSHVENGGVLLVFPSGAVSLYDKETGLLSDQEWNRSVSRIARKTQATTVPIYIDGRNSKLFYFLKKLNPILGTAMLPRELINKGNKIINIAIGEPIKFNEVKALSNDVALTNYYRLNTYLLSAQHSDNKIVGVKQDTNSGFEDIIPEVPKDKLILDISNLENDKLFEQGDFEVYCSQSKDIPNVLRELGRVRETSFRAVGEGTGKSLDIDEFDDYYLHLFIWDKTKLNIAGAYRLGLVDEIVSKKGIQGLYSRTLFNYENDLIKQLGNSIELGRSVIDQEYQKNVTTLLLLWQGLNKFLFRHPKYTTFWGPVSISDDYSLWSKQLLAESLSIHHYDTNKASLVEPTNPLKNKKGERFWHVDMLTALGDIQLLSKVISRIDPGKTVPVLLKKYIGITGKLICFNVDPAFNDCLDGLIVVNMLNVPEKNLIKWMGKEEAALYLDQHKSIQR